MSSLPRSMTLSHQRGAALIMALLIASLATILATSLIWQENLWLRGLETQRDLTQARQLALAGIDWARAILAEDARTSRYDHLGEPWATQVPAMPAEGGEIGGHITDEQGKLNLNNLIRNGQSSSEDLLIYQKLLSALQLPPTLASTLTDWLDADDQTRPEGAEDAEYLAAQPPYRAANRELTDVDNLQHVHGYTPEIIERLRPYVTALPGYNLLNINTASALVVSATLHDFSDADIRQIITDRDRIPYLDVDDFRKRLPQPEMGTRPSTNLIDTHSRYFTAHIQARIGQVEIRIQARLLRVAQWPNILWQKFE